MCVDSCSQDTPYVQQESRQCVASCDFYQFESYPVEEKDINIRQCVASCQYGIREAEVVRCARYCPSNLPYFETESNICSTSCDSGAYMDSEVEEYTYQCVENCRQYYEEIGDLRHCVTDCPADNYYFGTKCVTQCPSGNELIQDRQCVSQC